MSTSEPAKTPHSGWGIASIISNLLSWPLFLLLAAILAHTQPTEPQRTAPGLLFWFIETLLFGAFKQSLAETVKILLIYPGLGMLCALGLGIAGCFQRERDHLLAQIGILSSAVGLLFVLLMAFV